MSREITYRARRFDPTDGRGPHWEEYKIAWAEGMTVLDGLWRIKETQAPGLAWRASCRMGVCGSCGMLINLFSKFLLFALVALAGAAWAQTWTPEQQELWKLEEQQWQMAKDKDLSWIDKMTHPNLSYWGADQHSPQNRASLARWNRYDNTNATVLEQELFPISATITGNIAVVHYRYTIARENYKKERETVNGRYTDVLVKEGRRWLFIAWAGGDDPKK